MLAALTVSVFAQPAGTATVDDLLDLLEMREIFEILREEGQDYGADLEEDLLGGEGRAPWRAKVDGIYDTDRRLTQFRDRLALELTETDLGPMRDFLATPLGQRIATLEVSARRALLDPAVEEECLLQLDEARALQSARLTSVQRLTEAGDLIESNVAGALNTNYAFLSGLSDGGDPMTGADPADPIGEIWALESEIRNETENWMQCYLLMALAPLSDAEIETYITFAASPAGQRLNRAMFVAFNVVFTEISYQLGYEVARFTGSDEL